MKRLTTFLLGMIAGGILLWTALHYHLLHARDGLHLVPKATTSLTQAYVDVRNFTPRDWLNYPEVAEAVLRSENQTLIDAVMSDTLQSGLDRWLPAGDAALAPR